MEKVSRIFAAAKNSPRRSHYCVVAEEMREMELDYSNKIVVDPIYFFYDEQYKKS